MYAVVVISLMFGAVIVMVKKADKEMITIRISGSSTRMRPNPDPHTRRVTAEDFIRLTHQTLTISRGRNAAWHSFESVPLSCHRSA
jgi:hypothetical protein